MHDCWVLTNLYLFYNRLLSVCNLHIVFVFCLFLWLWVCSCTLVVCSQCGVIHCHCLFVVRVCIFFLLCMYYVTCDWMLQWICEWPWPCCTFNKVRLPVPRLTLTFAHTVHLNYKCNTSLYRKENHIHTYIGIDLEQATL